MECARSYLLSGIFPNMSILNGTLSRLKTKGRVLFVQQLGMDKKLLSDDFDFDSISKDNARCVSKF
jgi:hypothetical protein